MQLIVFTLKDRYYAFSTEKVEEITTKLEATNLPQAPVWAEGLVNLRGQIMTLANLEIVLNGADDEAASWYNNTVIVNGEENAMALKVGTVIGVTNVEESDIQSAGEEESSVLSGLVSIYDEMVSVIDLSKVFTDAEEVILAE